MGTDNLALPFIATNQASPEIPANNAINIFDKSINGAATFATADADVTLTALQFIGALVLKFTGVDTSDRNVTIPQLNADGNPLSKMFVVENDTTGGYNLVVTTGAGTTVSIAASDGPTLLHTDGTDVVSLGVRITSLDASLITSGVVALARGGTGVDLSASGGTTKVLAQDGSHVVSARDLVAGDIPNLAASKITTGQLALARGGTGVDLSATGGTTKVLAQDASHVVSARDLIAADLPATAVTAGSYTGADITVDAQGRITAASTGVLGINTQTASYTLVLGDQAKLVRMNVGSANNLTVPLNASVAFPTGTVITVRQTGAGVTTIVATGGVTINSPSSLVLRVQNASVSLVKVASDTWDLSGDTV
jgi:hypothetical protein